MTLYTQVAANRQKSGLYLVLMTGLVLLVGYVAGRYLDMPLLLPLAAVISIIQGLVGYYASDSIALAASGAQPLESNDGAVGERVHRLVEVLTISTGLPKPRVFLIPQPGLNAFATGRDAEHAAIAVTAGLVASLNDRELSGVLAHELAHVGNEDIRLSSLVAVLAGSLVLLSDLVRNQLWWGGFSRRDDEREGGGNGVMALVALVLALLAPLAATLIQLAISRKREFLADATAVLTTRDAPGMISALQKLAREEGITDVPTSQATAHLFFANPLNGKSLANLLSTHPALEERIAALQKGSGLA